jgi:DNA-binding response OmpR family regulator
LSIVKNLTELHEGRVEVESELGKGSTFIVTIPRKEKKVTSEFKGLRILIVEDSPDSAEVMKAYFKSHEADVSVASSAKEAREVASSKDFDLFLLDIAMPDEDGISLLKSLREMGKKAPSVAVSAFTNYEKLVLNSGFDMFLSKPLNFDELTDLAKLIKRP